MSVLVTVAIVLVSLGIIEYLWCQPTLREILRLLQEGGQLKRIGEKHFKNKYVAVTYISNVGQSSRREALFIRLRYRIGIAGFVFENNKLIWQAHVAEEKINGQVFRGHERNFVQKILERVRAAVAQSEPPKIV